MHFRVPHLGFALSVLACALPAAAHDPQPALTPQARFAALDANSDGLLTRYEYDTDVALAASDSNHDQFVSVAELEAVWGVALPGEPSAADRMLIADLDADGRLDDAELQRAVGLRFTWLDRNGDGNLEPAEVESTFGKRVRPGD